MSIRVYRQKGGPAWPGEGQSPIHGDIMGAVMIHDVTHGVVAGLLTGGAALIVGLVPGLFDDVAEGVERFGHAFLFRGPLPPPRRLESGRRQRRLGPAIVGAIMVALALLRYALNRW